MTIIKPTPSERAKLNAASNSDAALASVAADCILDCAGGRLGHQYILSAQRSATWPDGLHMGWTRGNLGGIRTTRITRAKSWMVEAFCGGLAPAMHMSAGDDGRVELGTLTDIRCSAMSAPAPTVNKMLPHILKTSIEDMAALGARRSPKFVCDNGHTLQYAGEWCFKCDCNAKGPNGVHTRTEVREIIRRVALELSKQDAKSVLLLQGGGVDGVGVLEPSYFDRVYARCEELLKPRSDGALDRTELQRTKLDRLRSLVRAVAGDPDLGREAALDILNDKANVSRVPDVAPADYDAVIDECCRVLNKSAPVTPSQSAPVTPIQPEPACASPFEDVTEYAVEFFDGLGDALIGRIGDERLFIGAFNERRHADYICALLRATVKRDSDEQSST